MGVKELMNELSEEAMARNATFVHDDARNAYHLSTLRIENEERFLEVITDYVQHHQRFCGNGAIDRVYAAGKAKEFLNAEVRNKNGVKAACLASIKNIDGGIGRVLDAICEGFKREAQEYYTRDVFDRHLSLCDRARKEDLLRQFVQFYDGLLPGIDKNYLGHYVPEIETIIQAVVNGLAKTASVIRRI